jgi:gentisate 1,2-dioxygenase
VARGTGTLVCGRKSFDLLPCDVAAIPAWTWHQVTAGDQELVLLQVTDRPVHEALGLYRSETAPGIAP